MHLRLFMYEHTYIRLDMYTYIREARIRASALHTRKHVHVHVKVYTLVRTNVEFIPFKARKFSGT